MTTTPDSTGFLTITQLEDRLEKSGFNLIRQTDFSLILLSKYQNTMHEFPLLDAETLEKLTVFPRQDVETWIFREVYSHVRLRDMQWGLSRYEQDDTTIAEIIRKNSLVSFNWGRDYA